MTESLMQITVEPVEALVLSILVLYLGMYLNDKIRFLGDNYIPPSVTGGLICSAIVAVVYSFFDMQLNFDMKIRDALLLVFFSTVGLSAKLRTLASGGKALGLLVMVAAIFLVIQDATGIALAMLLDAHPGYGLLAGSVSFAGGHGTAIAWGAQADAAGLKSASEIGIAFATFGLVAGGIIGGPIAKRLVTKYKLQGPTDESASENIVAEAKNSDEHGTAGELKHILAGILILALCVQFGHGVNRYLFAEGVVLPGFLTSMLVGIIITNAIDLTKWKINTVVVERFGEVSLNIFLSMSLMSMQLWTLAGAFGQITLVLIIQMLVMTVFAIHVVFWVMGRNYDAAVIASGFAGLGLGATPVAIANMSSVTSRFGPSPKAYLVVPLVGAFFIDLLNAATIKFFIGVIKNWLI